MYRHGIRQASAQGVADGAAKWPQVIVVLVRSAAGQRGWRIVPALETEAFPRVFNGGGIEARSTRNAAPRMRSTPASIASALNWQASRPPLLETCGKAATEKTLAPSGFLIKLMFEKNELTNKQRSQQWTIIP